MERLAFQFEIQHQTHLFGNPEVWILELEGMVEISYSHLVTLYIQKVRSL